MNFSRFIDDERACLPVVLLCRMLGVSGSVYYAKAATGIGQFVRVFVQNVDQRRANLVILSQTAF